MNLVLDIEVVPRELRRESRSRPLTASQKPFRIFASSASLSAVNACFSSTPVASLPNPTQTIRPNSGLIAMKNSIRSRSPVRSGA